jgi:hypothetical protein
VPGDQRITIAFSEPMNAELTEAAYESTDLPRSAVAAQWSANRTVLTLAPNGPLAYAEGTDPASVTARTFALAVTVGAEDEAGNRLTQDYNWSFRTRRRINSTHRPLPQGTSWYWAISKSSSLPESEQCPNAPFSIGAHGGDPFVDIGFVAFDVATLPTNILIEAATLSATQTAPVGSPYTVNGNAIHASHIANMPVRQGLSPQNVPVLTATAVHELADFSSSPTVGLRSIDALVAVQDDYAHRAERENTSQYRLMFSSTMQGAAGPTWAEHSARFDCASIKLDVRYSLP